MFRIVAINVKVIGILRIYILSVVQDEKQWRRRCTLSRILRKLSGTNSTTNGHVYFDTKPYQTIYTLMGFIYIHILSSCFV